MTNFSTMLVLFSQLSFAGQGEPAPRRFYALHSGVHILLSHPDKNHAALVLHDELRRRGVEPRNLVVLENPFPEASWKNAVPRDGLVMFFDSMTPTSKVSYDAYRRMHLAFQAHGVGPKDEIVWIGHSAGGQMGMTMATLSADLAKHPDLAKCAKPYRFHTIVTLGTPVGGSPAPSDVQVRHYFSPQDKVVRIVCDLGPWILPAWGYQRTVCPCTLAPGKNCLTRCWFDVEHPDWIYEPRVLDRVMADVAGTCRSHWREPQPTERPGTALAQLLCQMLEEQQRLAIEEFPK